MKRRAFVKGVLLSSTLPVAGLGKSNASAKTVAGSLLRLANTIQSAQMAKSDRDKYSEILAGLSAEIQRAYNTGALCDTDADCVKKFGGQI